MKKLRQHALATEPRAFIGVFAVWILIPTAIAVACALSRGVEWGRLWVVPSISALIFVGSLVSHVRARRGLCATPKGLVWRMPSRWEFLGGIVSRSIEWDEIEACRLILVRSRDFGDYCFDAIEIHLRSTFGGRTEEARRGAGAMRPPGEERFVIGDESWTWTKDGRSFLEACRTADGWRRWREVVVGIEL